MAEQTGRGSGAKYPQYCTVAVRLQSFVRWSSSSHLQPTELAEAGFFYQGLEDRVKCFSCAVELSGWRPEDEAWAEHERLQPTCEHVLQHRMGGMNLSNNDVDEALQHREEDPIQDRQDVSKERDHETLEEELQRLRFQFACKTCRKEKACMVILPCCHLSACPACVEKLQKCNVCQQHIQATVKAYCA